MDPTQYNVSAARKAKLEEKLLKEHRRNPHTHKLVGDELSAVSEGANSEDDYSTSRRSDTGSVDSEATTPRPRRRSPTESFDSDATPPRRVSVSSENSYETSPADSVRSASSYASVDNPIIVDEAGYSPSVASDRKTARSPPSGRRSLPIGTDALLAPSRARLHPRIRAKFPVKSRRESDRACRTVPPKVRCRERPVETSPLFEPLSKMRRALDDIDVRDALTTARMQAEFNMGVKPDEDPHRRASAGAIDRMWRDYRTINKADNKNMYRVALAATRRYRRRISRRGG